NVESTSSFTLPAHGSMLSGLLPSRHGAEADAPGRNQVVADDLLAMRLRDAGWMTAAFTGSTLMSPWFGFDQGFDRYDATDLLLNERDVDYRSFPKAGDPDFNRAYRNEHTLDRALEWLRTHRDGPFFLFLHTYLVHGYSPSAPFEARLHSSCASALGDDLHWI